MATVGAPGGVGFGPVVYGDLVPDLPGQLLSEVNTIARYKDLYLQTILMRYAPLGYVERYEKIRYG